MIDRLKAEFDAISQRIADAKTDAERATLETQFGERLSHLKARIEEASESPSAPAQKGKK